MNQYIPGFVIAAQPPSRSSRVFKIGGVDTVSVDETTEQGTNKQAELLPENWAMRIFAGNFAKKFCYPSLKRLRCFLTHHQASRGFEKLFIRLAKHFAEIGFVAGLVHPLCEQIFSGTVDRLRKTIDQTRVV
jgi:hypothetical protein